VLGGGMKAPYDAILIAIATIVVLVLIAIVVA
jgi:hypothetical protein